MLFKLRVINSRVSEIQNHKYKSSHLGVWEHLMTLSSLCKQRLHILLQVCIVICMQLCTYRFTLHSQSQHCAHRLHTHPLHSCINRSVHHHTLALSAVGLQHTSDRPLMHSANPMEGGRYSRELVMVVVVGGGNYGWASGSWQTSLCPPGEHCACCLWACPSVSGTLCRRATSLPANRNL